MGLGLFGTLSMGTRSLQVQQLGVETAGHNLANVNNPEYARQRLHIETEITIPTPLGPQGTGANAVALRHLRDILIDAQVQTELSVTGSLMGQQEALQYGQANLGQQIDRQASGAQGAAAAQDLIGQYGIAEGMGAMFGMFQDISVQPGDLAVRQVLTLKAETLANQLNSVDQRLGALTTTLDQSLASDALEVNVLLAEIAGLNDAIRNSEINSGGVANDLRDTREARVEDLSKLVQNTATYAANGSVNIDIDGISMVDDDNVLDTIETYDAGGGQMLVRTSSGGTPLALTGGHMHGTITARDGALATLRTDVNDLAALFITEVNTLHAAGYSLTGSTGANFFTGADASDIAVNSVLLNDPSLIQASGVSGAVGDNQVALALAQLADTKHASLSNQTFSESYAQTVTELGQALATVNSQSSTQEVVQTMLLRQRDSVIGVSLDEEMTDIIKFQRAYQASAKLIITIDEMLETVMSLKR